MNREGGKEGTGEIEKRQKGRKKSRRKEERGMKK